MSEPGELSREGLPEPGPMRSAFGPPPLPGVMSRLPGRIRTPWPGPLERLQACLTPEITALAAFSCGQAFIGVVPGVMDWLIRISAVLAYSLFHDRIGLLPRKYPVEQKLTERVKSFGQGDRSGRLTVHVDPYNYGPFEAYAFRKGGHILVSEYSRQYSPPDQLEFILARETFTPWWGSAALYLAALLLGLRSLRGIGSIDLIYLALLVGGMFATWRYDFWKDSHALRITKIFSAASAAVARLPEMSSQGRTGWFEEEKTAARRRNLARIAKSLGQ